MEPRTRNHEKGRHDVSVGRPSSFRAAATALRQPSAARCSVSAWRDPCRSARPQPARAPAGPAPPRRSGVRCRTGRAARHCGCRSRTTSAIETGSPELILASYSWARRFHMARLTRLRPFRVTSALSMILRDDSLRRPEIFAFATGTPQHHALLLERDDEQVQLVPGDLLGLDVDHAADAMRRVNHEIALLEGVFLRLGHNLLRLGSHFRFFLQHPYPALSDTATRRTRPLACWLGNPYP